MAVAKNEESSQAVSPMTKIMRQINKTYGRGTIMTADFVSKVNIPRIGTGIWIADKALGGGLPVGRISLVYGDKSTGKTTFYIRAVANAQRMCANCYRRAVLVPGKVLSHDPNTDESFLVDSMVVGSCECGSPRSFNIAWVDQEGTWDPNWAAAHGVIKERLVITRPQFAEEAVDIVAGLIETEGSADIVVLDSIAQMSPIKEIEDSATEFAGHPGMTARLMGAAVRKWNSGLQARFRKSLDKDYMDVPSVWLVNQIRLKIGIAFGSPETTPGGKAVGFATSVEIRTAPGQYKVDDKLMETYHVELGFKVNKNKTAPARQGGKYKICVMAHGPYTKGQVMDHSDVLFHGLRLGVIEQVTERKIRLGDDEYMGKKALVDYWAANPDVYETVKEMVLQRALAD